MCTPDLPRVKHGRYSFDHRGYFLNYYLDRVPNIIDTVCLPKVVCTLLSWN